MDDARGKPIDLVCPCGRRLRRVDAGAVATTVVDVTCRACHRAWRVILRPLSATADAVVRQAEWTELRQDRCPTCGGIVAARFPVCGRCPLGEQREKPR